MELSAHLQHLSLTPNQRQPLNTKSDSNNINISNNMRGSNNSSNNQPRTPAAETPFTPWSYNRKSLGSARSYGGGDDRFIPRRHSSDTSDLFWQHFAHSRGSTSGGGSGLPVEGETPGTPTSTLEESPFYSPNPNWSSGRRGEGEGGVRRVGPGGTPVRTRPASQAGLAEASGGKRRNSSDRVLNLFSPQVESRRSSLSSTPRRAGSPLSRSPLNLFDELKVSSAKPGYHRQLPAQPENSHTFPGIKNDIASNILSWSRKRHITVAVRHTLHRWLPRSGKPPIVIRAPPPTGRVVIGHHNDVTALAWNPAGSCLAFGTLEGDVFTIEDWNPNQPNVSPTKLRDAWSAEEEESTDSTNRQITSIAWNPDKTDIFYIGTLSGRIEQVDTKESCHNLIGSANGAAIYRLAVSPDGAYIATSHSDNIIVIICLKTTTVTQEIFAHKSLTKALAWCPWKPHLLATGGGSKDDGYIRVWDVDAPKMVQEAEAGGEEQQILELVWSERTRELVSSHGGRHAYILVWPSSLTQYPARMSGHLHPVRHLDISPDGTRLASLSADGTLHVWHCLQTTTTRPRLTSLPPSQLMCIR